MSLEKMLELLSIGSYTLKNRFVVAAMVTSMCDEQGYATDRYIAYREAKAKGSYGPSIAEDYVVNAHAGGYQNVARIYDESMIPGHHRLTDAVHKYGARIFAPIYHAGRQTNSKVDGGVPVKSASHFACTWNRQMLEEPTKEEIKGIVHDVDVTVKNVKTDSFDGVEIHVSNGYLIAGFLLPEQAHRRVQWLLSEPLPLFEGSL